MDPDVESGEPRQRVLIMGAGGIGGIVTATLREQDPAPVRSCGDHQPEIARAAEEARLPPDRRRWRACRPRSRRHRAARRHRAVRL